MSNTLHGALVFLVMLCLCPAAYGEPDSKDVQDAELRFSIQMTSALNNDPKAQFLVAEMYEQGAGTPQNLRMAHLWYTKSANQKYAPAIAKLASWGSENKQTEAATAATTAVKAAQATETAPAAKEKQPEINRPKDKSKGTTEKSAEKGDGEFKANPCKTPTAKFTSTCQ